MTLRQMATTLSVPNLSPTAPAAISTDLPHRITVLATTILGDILLIAGILAVFFIIYGGFRYISAGGDAAKTKIAQSTIISAVIGVAIIASAFGLMQLAVKFGLLLKGGNDQYSATNGSQSDDPVNTSTTTNSNTDSSATKSQGSDSASTSNDSTTAQNDTRTTQQKFDAVLVQCSQLDTQTQMHFTTCRDYFMGNGEEQFNKACASSPELKVAYYYCNFDFKTAIEKLRYADAHPIKK